MKNFGLRKVQGKTDSACADCPGFLVLGAAPAPASTFVSEPQIVPCAGILLHGHLEVYLDLLPAAPLQFPKMFRSSPLKSSNMVFSVQAAKTDTEVSTNIGKTGRAAKVLDHLFHIICYLQRHPLHCQIQTQPELHMMQGECGDQGWQPQHRVKGQEDQSLRDEDHNRSIETELHKILHIPDLFLNREPTRRKSKIEMKDPSQGQLSEEEDRRATTNVQNGLVFFFLFSFILFYSLFVSLN